MDCEEPVMNAQDLEGSVQMELVQEMKETTTTNPLPVPKRRGRKPAQKSSDKVDLKTKLEKSRQSARDCRNRKKVRYQYLSDAVDARERAVLALREELEKYRQWCINIDAGIIPEEYPEFLREMNA